MISNYQFNNLEAIIKNLLSNAKKRDSIKTQIIGNNGIVVVDKDSSDKLLQCASNKEIRSLKEEALNLINGLNKEDLYNLFITFSIGKLCSTSENPTIEYNLQLKKAKRLCNDKYYIDKFIDMTYDYLENYLINGLSYVKKNILIK